MTALKKIFKQKITIVGGKSKTHVEILAKDRHSLKQDYDLLEFAINIAE